MARSVVSPHLCLLGSPEVRIHGQTLPLQGRYRKALGLLAYLSAEPQRPHSREYLASVFWPDLDEQASRLNLRQVLFSLTRTLAKAGYENLIASDRHALQWLGSPELVVDIHQLEGLQLHCHDCVSGFCETSQRLLTSTYDAQLSGEFLPAYSLPDCEVFEDWLHAKRIHFRLRQTQLLQTLLKCAQRQGQPELLSRFSQVLLEIDPDDERLLREVMSICAESGQTGLAHKYFKHYAQRLEREMGLLPEGETLALHDRLHRAPERPSTHFPRPFPAVSQVSFAVVMRLRWVSLANDPEVQAQAIFDADRKARDWVCGYMQAWHRASAGNGSFFYFNWPQAVYYPGWQAICAAMRLLQDFQTPQLQLKIGLHCGRVLSSDEDSVPDLQGEMTDHATRLCNQAQPGQIRLSEALRELVGNRVKVGDPQIESDIGWKSYLLQTTSVLDLAPTLMPKEIAQSGLDRLEQVLKAVIAKIGELSQRVLIVGEPGSGKTCLIHHWLDSHGISGTALKVFHAYPDRYHESFGLLKEWVDLSGVNDSRVDFTADFSTLAAQLSHPDLRLVWLKDAQWCDPETLAFLDYWSALPEQRWTLLISTHDPDSVSLLCDHQIHVPALSDEAAILLCSQHSQRQGVWHSPDTLHRIVQVAEGNPLSLMILSGRNQPFARLPDSLLAFFTVVAEDLGVLKSAAMTVAAVGMETEKQLLISLLEQSGEKNAQQKLEQLVACGVLQVFADQSLKFARPLLQWALNELNPPSRYRYLNRVMALSLEYLNTDRPQPLKRLAYHWGRAGETQLAGELWMQAGNMAWQCHDYPEVMQCLGEAVELHDQAGFAPEDAVTLYNGYAQARILCFGYGDQLAFKLSTGNEPVALAAGNQPQYFRAAYLRFLGVGSQQEDNASLPLAQHLIDIAENDVQLVIGCWAMTNSLFWLGDFGQSIKFAPRGLKLAESHGPEAYLIYSHENPYVHTLCFLGWSCYFSGQEQAALRWAQKLLDSLAEVNLNNACFGLFAAGTVLAWCGEEKDALRQARRCHDLAIQQDFHLWICASRLLLLQLTSHSDNPADPAELDWLVMGIEQVYADGAVFARWMAVQTLLNSAQREAALGQARAALTRQHGSMGFVKAELERLVREGEK